MNSELEWTQNLDLLRDNLRHLNFELSDEQPFWFRVGKEAYHALCRCMVEALRGSANLDIMGGRRPKGHHVHYLLGDQNWQMIEKTAVATCRLAWRFSSPVAQDPPATTQLGERTDDRLVGFFDMLAMIQAECFMSRMVEAGPIDVVDADMRQLEWLHESVRNEFEHFMPKLYGAVLEDLRRGAFIALELSRRLLEESGNVFLLGDDADLTKVLRETQAVLRRVI